MLERETYKTDNRHKIRVEVITSTCTHTVDNNRWLIWTVLTIGRAIRKAKSGVFVYNGIPLKWK